METEEAAALLLIMQEASTAIYLGQNEGKSPEELHKLWKNFSEAEGHLRRIIPPGVIPPVVEPRQAEPRKTPFATKLRPRRF